MNYLKFSLKKVSEPPLNTVVFNCQNGIIFPCIVKSGQYYAENGRLSNFWYWVNLLTHKEEYGYGNFFVRIGTNDVLNNDVLNEELGAGSIFPQRLQKLREQRHMSRKVLGELCGLSKNAIGRYERGERAPTASALEAIADNLDVSIDYILGREKYS